MEQKTKLIADDGKQEILITRTFDLPVDLLFKAYTESELVEQWMGNKVLKMENQTHGSYQFETTDGQGNILFRANGSIHKVIENENITRTFEMENSGFPVQLEFLDFEPITDDKSKLTMKIVFRSVADRDNMLKLPFGQGINMAHNQLEKLISKLK
ncbi:MAG: SRPBCC domain-containing protein [Saprospiraceae bacterium]|nr:SRPBCC domain-containing protein [Saprospiraceae bacterium]MDP4700666.1 SRPBCC domain-containing protein [Saprospiraceae bacterium]MDP4810988.1 SRPBCC domain-containing protein [Saprospiraceae bacterium]MDP4813239.1 SRPBCC domain-containing protein [Saprospiraceae bacterium]MDP4913815.1 SRPBCC domain-containing protein [Saprospiraceae bacterium]